MEKYHISKRLTSVTDIRNAYKIAKESLKRREEKRMVVRYSSTE
jgi:hypothetical protein